MDPLANDAFVLSPEQHKIFADEFSAMATRMTLLKRNWKLYSLYKRSDCEKYTDIAQVPISNTSGTSTAPDRILIYISEIDSYGLYSAEAYRMFLQKISDYNLDCEEKLAELAESAESGELAVESGELAANLATADGSLTNVPDRPEAIQFTARQIVFTRDSQKVIFLCSLAETPSFIKLATEFFRNCTVTAPSGATQLTHATEQPAESEIMVSRVARDFAEASEIFHQFYRYVYGKNKRLAEHIRLPRRHIAPTSEYIYRTISSIVTCQGAPTIAEIITSLATYIPPAPAIVSGSNNTDTRSNISATSPSGSGGGSRSAARIPIAAWVRDNPPALKETPTNYYMRCLSEAEHVSIQALTKIAEAHGHTRTHSGAVRYWRPR